MANFSWFIGVFLGATTYRWLARDERVQAKAAFAPARCAKSNLPLLPRRLAAAGCKLAPILLFITIPRALREGRFDDGLPDRGARCIFDIAGVAETPDEVAARPAISMMACCSCRRENYRPAAMEGSFLHP